MISRLAPSPTGVLHLGNARSFLINWLYLRSKGGSLLLRIEDIDGPRLKAGAEELLLEDLQWMGLDWDGEPIRQSERLAHYGRAASNLLQAGLAYPCTCTRREIDAAGSAPQEEWQDASVYPGTCRGRYSSMAEALAESGRQPALRLQVDDSALPFEDHFAGSQPGLIRGDFVIQKRDGGPAYQLAVVVDDIASGVNMVIRGDDLLASTPRQLLIYRHLQAKAPEYMHLPLLVGPDGLRLAKRHGDSSLRMFREQGVSPRALVGYLAAISGLVPAGRECMPEELIADFDLSRMPKNAQIATAQELLS
ncbi:MAG: tRNA glutamyl-Q(34) synthetase GluQRS [Planctomycetota bacterium]